MANAAHTAPKASFQELQTKLAQMAGLVEAQLAETISAFERRDVAAAEKIIASDARIDALDRDIGADVMEILSAGPVSRPELREAMTVMKVSGDLERVGDLAKNVAKRTLVLSREKPMRPIAGVARMGRASLRQISDILNAYAARNLTAARAVWSGDDEVDELYNSVFKEILLAMMENSAYVNACTHLVFIAKNFERVGDHATNIAEAVHFLMTGDPLIEERPKGDETSTASIRPHTD
ncbi:MAG: phosphate signaling complex protein PhoU [Parvularculaceae bacterium]